MEQIQKDYSHKASDLRVNPYSAGVDFRIDPRAKIDPCTVRVKLFIMAVDP